MKKFLLSFLVFALVFGAATLASAQSAEKFEAWLGQLNAKMKIAKADNDLARIARLRPLIEQAKEAITAKKRMEDKGPATPADSSIEELKLEINEAILSLNSQIKEVEKKVNKGATVNGRAYIYWRLKDQTNSAVNKFDISRVYLDFKKKLNQDASARFTTDITRQNSFWNDEIGAAKDVNKEDALIVYLKYAYFELGNIPKYIPGTGLFGLEKIKVGQQQTHWIDFMQKHWKFRYVAKTLTDHYKLYSSADMGVSAFGSFDLSSLEIPYIGRFKYHAMLSNGTGYKDPEDNGGKDLALTIITEPVRWGKKDVVTVAAGYLMEDVGLSGFDTNVTKKLSAMAAYAFSKPGKGLVFTEFANQQGSATGGYCFGGQYLVLPNTNAFARHDSYKKSGSDYVQSIYGMEYNWGKNVKIALDYQAQTKDGTDDNKSVYLHSRVKW